MRHCPRRFRSMSVSLALTATALVPCAQAQEGPALERLLDDIRSPQVSVRAIAVAHLSGMPVAALSANGRGALVGLLEAEATGTAPAEDQVSDAPDDELWGEYIIDLTDLVVRMADPRALRGLSLLGIQTSRSAQEFVAHQGEAALPFLDEAWDTTPSARPSVIQTWGRILLLGDGSALSSGARNRLLERLASGAPDEPLAVASASRKAVLLPLMPILLRAAHRESDEIVATEIARSVAILRAKLRTLSRSALFTELTSGLRLACLGSQGPRRGACESVQNLAATAEAHGTAKRTAPLLNTLDALVRRAEQAERTGALVPPDVQYIREMVSYIRLRS